MKISLFFYTKKGTWEELMIYRYFKYAIVQKKKKNSKNA